MDGIRLVPQFPSLQNATCNDFDYMAGINADLFGLFAETTCATIVLVASSCMLENLGTVTLVLGTAIYKVDD